MSFAAGQMIATLMVSTMDDSTTELSEYFMVMITSTDSSDVEIGSPNRAFITIEDNDLSMYMPFLSMKCLMDYACMYTCIVYAPYTIGTPMQLHSSGVGVMVLLVCIFI